MMERAQPNRTTRLALDQWGIAPGDLRTALDVPATKMLAVPMNPRPERCGLGEFGPVADGTLLHVHPLDPVAPPIWTSKPLIVGRNRDEAVFFCLAECEFDLAYGRSRSEVSNSTFRIDHVTSNSQFLTIPQELLTTNKFSNSS
jgi:hypothetical protein